MITKNKKRFYPVLSGILVSFILFQLDAQTPNVILTGVTEDTTVKSIDIRQSSYFWMDFDAVKTLAVVPNTNNNTFNIHFYIAQPTLLYFGISIGETAKILVQPGDSLRFKIKKINSDIKVRFEGENSLFYNYLTDSDSCIRAKQGWYYPSFKKEEGLAVYKDKIDEWFKIKNEFLENYFRDKNVGDFYITYFKEELKYEYVYLFYSPVLDVKGTEPWNSYQQSDNFNTGNPTHISFEVLLGLTFKYILSSNDLYSNSVELYKMINNSFHGFAKEHLLANLTGILSRSSDLDQRENILKIITDCKSTITDSLCLNYINRSEATYKILNQPLPQNVRENTFLTDFKTNKKISLDKLLQKFKNKPLYIDFWASSCGPCRFDIANSQEAKKLLNDNNYQCIYISVDAPSAVKKWKEATLQDGIAQNQYLLIDERRSPLAKYFNLTYIPRYIIFNPDHSVKDYDAPRPTIPHLSKLKSAIEQKPKQIIKFD